jgi:hypothetical protein
LAEVYPYEEWWAGIFFYPSSPTGAAPMGLGVRRSPHDAEAEESQKEMALSGCTDLRTLVPRLFYHEVLTAKSYQRKVDVLADVFSTPGRRVSGASQLMGL